MGKRKNRTWLYSCVYRMFTLTSGRNAIIVNPPLITSNYCTHAFRYLEKMAADNWCCHLPLSRCSSPKSMSWRVPELLLLSSWSCLSRHYSKRDKRSDSRYAITRLQTCVCPVFCYSCSYSTHPIQCLLPLLCPFNLSLQSEIWIHTHCVCIDYCSPSWRLLY